MFLEEDVVEANVFLSLSDQLRVEHVTATATALIVEVVSTPKGCGCPACGQLSDRIHSHYQRVIADVPCGNRSVTLQLHVRKFFCRTPNCPRKIFTERLPGLVQPWARLTNRLRTALEELGLATGGEGGFQLAPKLSMPVGRNTLLRRVRAVPVPEVKAVRVLGIDDWAFKRGQHYGTILVDLERHRVIDLLADRSKETAQAWLRQHPQIEVISRDRAGNYADAAREGAPQAMQVADRFHLLKNVRESLKDLLDRKRSCLPFQEEEVAASPGSSGEPPGLQETASQVNDVGHPESVMLPASVVTEEELPSGRLSANERRRQFNREKRYALYEEVWNLRRQGMSHYAIADALGISRPTVRRFLAAEQFPERHSGKRAKRKSILAPSLAFLQQRWQEGCHNGHQLFREAKARGYAGSQAQLGRLITQWRKQLPPCPPANKARTRKAAPPAPPKRQKLSSQQASWLFVLSEEQLTAQQHRYKEQIVQASEELALAYQLSQDFVSLLKERKAADLQPWLQRASHSHIAEFKSLARGMQRDYAAVEAACCQPWSQGQVEGHVNRLKCLKRQMYGRANFDLLRLRVLHAA